MGNREPARNLSPGRYTITGKRASMPFVAVNMAAIPRELIEFWSFSAMKGPSPEPTGEIPDALNKRKAEPCSGRDRRHAARGADSATARFAGRGIYRRRRSRSGPFQCPHHRRHPPRSSTTDLPGLFREDLYYRLDVVPMRLPPLWERTEDIPEPVNHFLSLCSEEGLPSKIVDETAMDRLKRYHWPGNVRELETCAAACRPL